MPAGTGEREKLVEGVCEGVGEKLGVPLGVAGGVGEAVALGVGLVVSVVVELSEEPREKVEVVVGVGVGVPVPVCVPVEEGEALIKVTVATMPDMTTLPSVHHLMVRLLPVVSHVPVVLPVIWAIRGEPVEGPLYIAIWSQHDSSDSCVTWIRMVSAGKGEVKVVRQFQPLP